MSSAERSRRYRARRRRERLAAFEATPWGKYVMSLQTIEDVYEITVSEEQRRAWDEYVATLPSCEDLLQNSRR
jgi:hypothetical protein